MANIKARRKLSDLYKRGVEVRFGPGPQHRIPDKGEGLLLDADGEPVPLLEDEIQVWVQPPSPLQREMAMRDAQASRAKSLIRAKREEGSEEHLTIMAFLADMTDETLIDYVLVQDSDERRSDAVREVLAEDEWKDMAAYSDAMRQYNDQLADGSKTMAELDQDPEWVALMERDAQFGDEVAKREAELNDTAREVLRMRPRGDVERKALAKRAEIVGTQAFMHEYESQMLFYSVREFGDNGVLFFESARELANEPDEIQSAIREAMVPFIQDSAEAKNLQGVVSGSGSSELPSEPEISAASTPETASE